MDVVNSSPYHPARNGLSERTVQELKKYLAKNGALKGSALDEMVLHLNSQDSSIKGAGDAFERFFCRSPRLSLPGLESYSLVEQQALNVRRLRAQEAVALKKGRGNAEQFKEGDAVRVRNIKLGVWDLKGTINKGLPREDGKTWTYKIL